MRAAAVLVLAAVAVALLVRLKLGSSLDSKRVHDWFRRF